MWTHHMKNITYNEAFIAQGAPASEVYNGECASSVFFYRVSFRHACVLAITLEAGVQWGEAYDVVQAHGRVLVGGLSGGGTVGAAGGWLLGGGHSMLSPWYGLGKSNLVNIFFTLLIIWLQELTMLSRSVSSPRRATTSPSTLTNIQTCSEPYAVVEAAHSVL